MFPWRGAILLCLATAARSAGVDRHLKVVALKQPPFTLTRLDGSWTGIEARFLEILAKPLNFTFKVVTAGTTLTAPTGTWTSSDAAVLIELAAGVADLAIGGNHLIPETVGAGAEVRAVHSHSHDCGVFVTQATLALPRHRAIMGPFHWKVWLALTMAYLFGAVPLALLSSTSRFFLALQPRGHRGPSAAVADLADTRRDHLVRCLRSILSGAKEISRKALFLLLLLHDAFWDIFGTFTNAFTLSKGWRISSLEDMMITAIVGTEGLRLLVAFYWAFTVIVSALYTGSIIAFITLPVFPKPYDTGRELLSAGFTWGTLATGDWAQWLRETDNPVGEQVRRLTAKADSYGCGCRGMRLFQSAEKGIRAVEVSSSLAFLSSRTLLTYLIAHPASSHDDDEEEEEAGLFSLSILRKVVGKKRSGPMLAMSTECFLPFRVGFLVKGNAEGSRISEALKRGLLQAEQAGLLEKARRDADQEVGEGEEQEVNLVGEVVSSSEKRWRSMHGNRLLTGGGFRLGHGVLTERVLSLDDLQGLFLLLVAGFGIAHFALFMEIVAFKMKGKYCPDLAIASDSDWGGGFSDEEGEAECVRLQGSAGGGPDEPGAANFVRIESQSRTSAPDIGVAVSEGALQEPRTARRVQSACNYRH